MSEATPPDFASPPYLGPASFTRKETLYGRDREAQQLTGQLISERIVLLYSPSGAGKTSLVQAKVIPELERREFVVRPVLRVSRSLSKKGENRYLDSVALSLQGEGEQNGLPPLQSLDELLKQLRSTAEAQDEVLIFDQFEEILTLDPTDIAAKRDFFREIGRLLLDRSRWALFSMREDYVGALEPYLRFLPTRLSCSFRLDLLGEQAAAQAISKPAAARGVTIEPAAVQRLVDDLRRIQVQGPDGQVIEQPGPNVEPVQLQVVCLRLWRDWVARRAADTTTITEADLGNMGNEAEREAGGSVDEALRAYYDESVARVAATVPDGEPALTSQEVSARERDIRDFFDRHLITADGVRGQVLQGYQQTESLPNSELRELVDAYVVRSERRGGRTWYELAHDRLIRPVRASNDQWKREHLVPAQTQAMVWDEQGRPAGLLLRGSELSAAESWAARSDVVVTPLEREYLDACRELALAEARERRRNRLIRVLAVVASLVAVLAIGLAVFATVARNEATARQLASLSRQALETNPAAALLLANEAVGRTQPFAPLPDAINALYAALAASGGTPLLSSGQRLLAVAASPDGAYVAAAGDEGVVYVWPTANTTGQPIALRGHEDAITALAFAADSRTLVSGSNDGTARVWNVAAPDSSPDTLSQPGGVLKVVFNPADGVLATAGPDGTVLLWDLAAPDSPRTSLSGHVSSINAMAFAGDGTMLVTGSDDGTARIWSLGAPVSEPRVLDHEGAPVTTLAIASDGLTVATGDDAGYVRLWNATSGALERTMPELDLGVQAVAFSPDGGLVAASNFGSLGLIWRRDEPEAAAKALSGFPGSLSHLAFSSDGTTLITAGDDGALRLWNVQRPAEGRTAVHGHNLFVRGAVFGIGAQATATVGSDGIARLWDLQRLSPIAWLRGHDGGILSIVYHPSGDTLALTTNNGTAFQWNTTQASGNAVDVPFEDASIVAYSEDGRFLAAANFAGKILLVDRGEPEAAPVQLQASGEIATLVFSSNGNRLAALTYQDVISVFATDSATEPQTIPPQDQFVQTIAFSSDGERLAIGRLNGVVEIHSTAAPGAATTVYEAGNRPVTALAFSPDDASLATGSDDGSIRLFSATDANAAATLLRGHENTVYDLAWSPDGATLASASLDQTARLWKVEAPGQPSLTLLGQKEGLWSITFSPDGKQVATGDNKGRVRLWPTELDELQRLACVTAGRNLSLEEWEQFFGAAPYAKTCSTFPGPPASIDGV